MQTTVNNVSSGAFSPLSYTRAQKAKRPSKEEIQKQLDKANSNYNNGQGRVFLPEIYTK